QDDVLRLRDHGKEVVAEFGAGAGDEPYAERRSYAAVRRLWPGVDVVCTSMPLEFDEYVQSVGDERLMIDMMIGDLQRIIEYPARGFTVAQEVPQEVSAAYERLYAAGFVSRAVAPSS